MKIGILTWFFANNYGARAHTYALRQVILRMGHSCEFVNYRPKRALQVNLLGSIDCKDQKKHPYLVAKCLLRCMKFKQAQKLNPSGKKVRDSKDLDDLGYDLVIIGSDAIWNCHHPLFHPIYMGTGLVKTPVLSYAPSCEYIKEGDMLPESCIMSLKQNKGLTVRDSYSRDFIHEQTGVLPDVVLDPTLLWDFSSLPSCFGENQFLLVYAFSDWEEYSPQIRKYSEAHQLKIISVGRFCSWADHSYDAASFYEWNDAFRKASVVVTDSYHGTIFAIKNNKDLVVLARSDKMYKINDLMLQLSVELPFYSGEVLEDYLQKHQIDYSVVQERIAHLKNESLTILQNRISSI